MGCHFMPVSSKLTGKPSSKRRIWVRIPVWAPLKFSFQSRIKAIHSALTRGNVERYHRLGPFKSMNTSNNVLDRQVLTLNRNWFALRTTTVRDALLQLAAGAVTALDIQGENHLVPVKWDEWIKLPPLSESESIRTATRRIRMPTVIIACNFDKIPKRRAKFNLRNIAARDGFKCQYTGQTLSRDEWSMDHVIPLCRGGKDSPENVVLAHKVVNNKKGGKTPEEAGLKKPVIRELKAEGPTASHPHHEIFLKK